MDKSTRLGLGSFVQLPVVSLTLVFGTLVAVWFLYLACTLQRPGLFDPVPFRAIERNTYLAITGLDLALGIALLASVRVARRAAPGLVRGYLAGIVAGLALLGVVQAGAQVLSRAWPQESGVDPARIEAFLAGLEPEERAVLVVVRDELVAAVPDLLVATDDAALHFARDGRYLARLALRGPTTTLRLARDRGTTTELPPGPWGYAEQSGSRVSGLLEIETHEAGSRLNELRLALRAFLADLGKR